MDELVTLCFVMLVPELTRLICNPNEKTFQEGKVMESHKSGWLQLATTSVHEVEEMLSIHLVTRMLTIYTVNNTLNQMVGFRMRWYAQFPDSNPKKDSVDIFQ